MPTPASGAISILNMRTEITRGGGAVTIDDIRTRLGISGSISFNQVYDAEGFTLQLGSITITSKFGGATYNGFSGVTLQHAAIGTCTPAESSGTVSFAASSVLYSLEHNSAAGLTKLTVVRQVGSHPALGGSTPITAGYAAPDISRVVVDNTNRAFAVDNTWTVTLTGYTLPGSGTMPCVVQF